MTTMLPLKPTIERIAAPQRKMAELLGVSQSSVDRYDKTALKNGVKVAPATEAISDGAEVVTMKEIRDYLTGYGKS